MQAKFPITMALVERLIAVQFPEWKALPVTSVAHSGWDNKTFHLGKEMLVRLPSAEGYAAQIQKEQTWLLVLASGLPLAIPEPVAMGKPSAEYPWHWSVYRWLKGESANVLSREMLDMPKIALQLADFLKALHQLDIKAAPPPGLHNYWRGAHVKVYDEDTRKSVNMLDGLIDREKALAVWEAALQSEWENPPVWVHGDVASGNLLVQNGVLSAVIDFGCMAVGDPACDLVIAWTFFEKESQEIFKKAMGMDSNTWARARGWALWKAAFELAGYEDKACAEAQTRLYIIGEVIKEYDNSIT